MKTHDQYPFSTPEGNEQHNSPANTPETDSGKEPPVTVESVIEYMHFWRETEIPDSLDKIMRDAFSKKPEIFAQALEAMADDPDLNLVEQASWFLVSLYEWDRELGVTTWKKWLTKSATGDWQAAYWAMMELDECANDL